LMKISSRLSSVQLQLGMKREDLHWFGNFKTSEFRFGRRNMVSKTLVPGNPSIATSRLAIMAPSFDH